jgi:hypothetical protein
MSSGIRDIGRLHREQHDVEKLSLQIDIATNCANRHACVTSLTNT